jgi:branched-chain amino acid transport system permease protein
MPTIFLFVLLIVLPQAKLRAGAARLREYSPVPNWNTSILGAVLLVVGTTAVTGMMNRADQLYVVSTLLMALAVLSLVPLTGYAGLVSLAPMTFAGLGAVFMSTLPGDGNVLTLFLAVAIVAAIGAIVALPALRLEGIYLALATGAFALLVSTLIFNQSKVFPNGSADVPALRIPGIDLTQPRTKAIGLSVAFALVALCVVALRRSKLGRQFVAMKDSQLAGATLGMNLLRTKTLAFAISAAIASLAGALDAGKASTDLYTFDRSLPILLLAIAGGIGSIGGAFFGGFLLGANSVLSTIVPSLTNITKVTPGLIGLSLGRNPNGASHQIAESFRPVTEDRTSLIIAISGGLALWLLEASGVVTHWGFFGALAVWGLGCVPNLPIVLRQRGRNLHASLAFAAVGLGIASFLDDIFTSAPTGGRLLITIVLAIGTGVLIQRAASPRVLTAKSSPDLLGIDRDFTPEEVTEAEREIGAVL